MSRDMRSSVLSQDTVVRSNRIEPRVLSPE